jgi:serine protease AprX
LGSDLAEKATPEFVLALSRSLPRTPGDLGLETLAIDAPTAPATVVEFDPKTDLIQRVRQEMMSPRADGRADRRGDGLEELGPAVERLRNADRLSQRDGSVRALREDFHRTCGGVTDTLERVAGGRLRAGMEASGSGRPSPITHTCWLNRTVRTAADPITIAEVAADQAIRRIDVTRRIQADVTRGATTVGAPAFRQETGTSGAGVVVGVIDTEVALGHPALSDRVIHRRNYTEEPWGNPGDHGTAVAGIIGADSAQIAGIAPEATIYNYKILATSPFFDADDFFGSRAIQDALEDGAHVVNCSWGVGPAGDGTSREAVACDTAWTLGLAIVKSAGNRGPGSGTLTTPAEAAGVIAVGATDRDGTAVQSYSSRGPTPFGGHRPHLVAPGGDPVDQIISLLVDGGVGAVGWGTSFAAPHVAGLTTLLLSMDPATSPNEVRDRLIASCQPLPGFDQDAQGAGLVHLTRQVAMAQA